MPEDNLGTDPVEIVKRSFDAWNASTDDFEPLRVVFEAAGPDIVWDFTRFEGWPDRVTYSGLDGTRSLWETWVGTWTDFRTEPLRIEGRGNAVFAQGRQTARGRAAASPSRSSSARSRGSTHADRRRETRSTATSTPPSKLRVSPSSRRRDCYSARDRPP